ncbi:MAG: hypothetical protein C0519_09765 [Hyphomicrobium sp.]|nr:hypothetical protein [Hyphomicrobium sp.]
MRHGLRRLIEVSREHPAAHDEEDKAAQTTGFGFLSRQPAFAAIDSAPQAMAITAGDIEGGGAKIVGTCPDKGHCHVYGGKDGEEAGGFQRG